MKLQLLILVLSIALFGFETSAQEGLASDAEQGICKKDPSDAYVKAFVFLETEDQQRMLDSCHPADRGLPKQLTSKVRQVRKGYQNKFSTGHARCVYENGKPVIHTVSDAGTKQDVLFTKAGNFERLRILPQGRSHGRPSKLEGSYLEYSNFPARHSVAYYGVAKNSKKKIEREFLTDAEKALTEFRLGLEENYPVTLNFRNVCLTLGSVPPKAPEYEKTLPAKRLPLKRTGPSHSTR